MAHPCVSHCRTSDLPQYLPFDNRCPASSYKSRVFIPLSLSPASTLYHPKVFTFMLGTF
jgi:hypothetical protein